MLKREDYCFLMENCWFLPKSADCFSFLLSVYCISLVIHNRSTPYPVDKYFRMLLNGLSKWNRIGWTETADKYFSFWPINITSCVHINHWSVIKPSIAERTWCFVVALSNINSPWYPRDKSHSRKVLFGEDDTKSPKDYSVRGLKGSGQWDGFWAHLVLSQKRQNTDRGGTIC